jgi:hypothetical protein
MDTNRPFNPFVHERAVVIDDDLIVEWFCDDFNLARLITSTQNTFLIGNRGSGKTMMFKYSDITSLRYVLSALNNNRIKDLRKPPVFFGVYVPCREGALYKNESKLYDSEPKQSAVSKHMLALYLLFRLLYSLGRIPVALLNMITDDIDHKVLHNGLEEILNRDINRNRGLFNETASIVNQMNREAQNILNDPYKEKKFDIYHTAETILFPIFDLFGVCKILNNFHIIFLIDDADALDSDQMRFLNSWVGYRGHTAYSFKIAISRRIDYDFKTASKGDLSEGHDYTVIPLEYPYHHEKSDFGKLARSIIQKRLERISLDKDPMLYFPINKKMAEDLEKCKQQLKRKLNDEHPEYDTKQITDKVYKYHRSTYFRKRYEGKTDVGKTSYPPYSGFELITYISTGIIRNLLEPCYKMYDEAYDQLDEDKKHTGVRVIPPTVQTAVINSISHDKWRSLESGLSIRLKGVTREDDKRIYNLFSELASLFHRRLMSDISEPNANSFSVVGWDDVSERDKADLERYLDIAERAQLIYTRMGSTKDKKRLEKYYIPNRALWPKVGLDPHGQHARIYLSANVLLRASEGREIPFDKDKPKYQEVLFDDY